MSFEETIFDIKGETFNQLTDTIRAQREEINRLNAVLEAAKTGAPFDHELAKDAATIDLSIVVSGKTMEPFVNMKWGAQIAQLSPEEAREHAFMILKFAEISEVEATLFGFAMELAEGDANKAMPILMGFREFRSKQEGR